MVPERSYLYTVPSSASLIGKTSIASACQTDTLVYETGNSWVSGHIFAHQRSCKTYFPYNVHYVPKYPRVWFLQYEGSKQCHILFFCAHISSNLQAFA